MDNKYEFVDTIEKYLDIALRKKLISMLMSVIQS